MWITAVCHDTLLSVDINSGLKYIKVVCWNWLPSEKMRVEIIYIVWSFRDSLSYREFIMLGRSNRILMASYRK